MMLRGTLLRIYTHATSQERKVRENYVETLQRMLIHARGALLFFIMTNLAAFFSLYIFSSFILKFGICQVSQV